MKTASPRSRTTPGVPRPPGPPLPLFIIYSVLKRSPANSAENGPNRPHWPSYGVGRLGAPLERPRSCPGWPNSPPPRQAAVMEMACLGGQNSSFVLLFATDCTPSTYGPFGPGAAGSRYRSTSGWRASRSRGIATKEASCSMPFGLKQAAPAASASPYPPFIDFLSIWDEDPSSLPTSPKRRTIFANFLLLL